MIKGRIGIMPIGALSIAFAGYIQGIDTFIESRKTHYSVGIKLKIYIDNEIKEITLTNENYTNDINSLVNGKIPEIILFSPPNHRLVSTLDEVIGMILKVIEIRHPDLGDDISKDIPILVMLSNGIYYDDVMDYVTKNFESIDNNIREKIKGNIIRGTTLQTGIRIESKDIDTIFKPGTKGSITIAGGSKESKERIITLFKKYNYPVFEMEGEEVRRIEFDKAIVNLSVNAVQLSLILDDDSNIHDFTMGDLVSDRKMQDMCKKIIRTMVSIGVKTGIYKTLVRIENNEDEQKQLIDKISYEAWRKIEEKSKTDNVHIVSSIASVIERYKRGKLENKPLRLPPLEENIINYLVELSTEYNLVEEKKIIEDLRNSILHVCGKVSC